MMELLIGVVVGMVVMDFMWAWRMGIPQMLWARWKYRRKARPDYSQWTDD